MVVETVVTTTEEVVYVGARVGEAVGAEEGEAVGRGVGLAAVLKVTVYTPVEIDAEVLRVTSLPEMDVTVVVSEKMESEEVTTEPTAIELATETETVAVVELLNNTEATTEPVVV